MKNIEPYVLYRVEGGTGLQWRIKRIRVIGETKTLLGCEMHRAGKTVPIRFDKRGIKSGLWRKSLDEAVGAFREEQESLIERHKRLAAAQQETLSEFDAALEGGEVYALFDGEERRMIDPEELSA